MARLAFKKTTPEGLSVDVEEIEGYQLLIVTKPRKYGATNVQYAQILGMVGQEINTPTLTWYYEYEPLPKTVAMSRFTKALENRGYTVGTFDQFGNFRQKAA